MVLGESYFDKLRERIVSGNLDMEEEVMAKLSLRKSFLFRLGKPQYEFGCDLLLRSLMLSHLKISLNNF